MLVLNHRTAFAPLRIDTPFDQLFRRLADWPAATAQAAAFVPAVDLSETADGIEIRADVPGLKPAEIEVKVEDGHLILRGKRTESEAGARTFHLSERGYGEFERALALPEVVDTAHVKARYENGVLTVTLPKREESKPRAITVEVG
jgi:HSP20 family protein